MCPVVGGVEYLNEGCVLRLFLLQCVSLLKADVGQPELDFELRLNGLITNDKFCITRWGSIALAPDYRRQRP